MIYHIAKKTEWESGLKSGKYITESIEKEGFIHCSFLEQILPSANNHFKGVKELVLLAIIEEKVKAEIKNEDSYNKGIEFPHIYGSLNIDAVAKTFEFNLNNNGEFSLPKDIKN